MRDSALWLLIPTFPPLVLGIVVCAERRVAREISLGVVFLPGVLVVWTVWGWRSERRAPSSAPSRLSSSTSRVRCASFAPFPQGRVAFVICLPGALPPALSRRWLGRERIGADGWGEADLARVMAGALLRTDDLCSAVPVALARLSRALGLWAMAIELGAAVGGERCERERVVASVQALLCAVREHEGVGSAVER
jgi:hypothetical protein